MGEEEHREGLALLWAGSRCLPTNFSSPWKSVFGGPFSLTAFESLDA